MDFKCGIGDRTTEVKIEKVRERKFEGKEPVRKLYAHLRTTRLQLNLAPVHLVVLKPLVSI
jgi:hypothetical protein